MMPIFMFVLLEDLLVHYKHPCSLATFSVEAWRCLECILHLRQQKWQKFEPLPLLLTKPINEESYSIPRNLLISD